MARRAYPAPFHVEFTGSGQDQDWAGDVMAMSVAAAIAVAAARAAREGFLFTSDIKVTVKSTG